ncbi:hypothetical protein ABZW18_31040 [Streptomyces sp. NPDC004647]|uniref:hypothetical protein n=1 Tax=Streptomyces sp. NPDC004647 TaxID=3154671 RepID=UPI0033A837C5
MSEQRWEVGTLVWDSEEERIGVVIGPAGPRVRLRPMGGGRDWEADPACVRRASAQERLHAKVAQANAESRWGVGR